MTKSKSFWAAVAVLSLVAAGVSGYSIYNRLVVYFANDTLEIRSRPVPPLQDSEETDEEPATEVKPEPQPAVKESKQEPQKQKAVKTAFEYKSVAAKSVSLSGSFTKWKETKMAKREGVWRAGVYILPGNYLYHFIVDGKKTLDPGKAKTPSGESIVAVEEEGKPVNGK
ncbi:MAG: hypothetical protein A2270_05540 [Elusimicrobia bacterium RIFOXYA12_FULL_51_18]|nr:MAG: hypothetical protein A2270_05540 [Elusimicrobia bacterium RIFOXYA12_FULL_51_18]OGS28714.1 MAG: hypothetical protein A2218_11125 [Elusimicrobia bacterium RIFOXYA2_FULL_53_38]